MKKCNCQSVQQGIYEFLDGALSTEQAIQFDKHLSECRECRKLVELEQRFGGLMEGTMRSLTNDLTCTVDPSEILERNKRSDGCFRKHRFRSVSFFDRLTWKPVLLPLGLVIAIIIIWFTLTERSEVTVENGRQLLSRTHNEQLLSPCGDDEMVGDSLCDWKRKRLYVTMSNPVRIDSIEGYPPLDRL